MDKIVHVPQPCLLAYCTLYTAFEMASSETYRHYKFILPSQQYSFHLVRQAIKKKKVIIFQRSKKIWTSALQELLSYPTFELRSHRAPYLSRRNLGNEAFEKVTNILGSKAI